VPPAVSEKEENEYLQMDKDPASSLIHLAEVCVPSSSKGQEQEGPSLKAYSKGQEKEGQEQEQGQTALSGWKNKDENITAIKCMFIPERVPLVTDLYKFCIRYGIDISDAFGHGKRLSRIEIIGKVYQFFLEWHDDDGTDVQDSLCYVHLTQKVRSPTQQRHIESTSVVKRSHKKFLDRKEAHRRFKNQGYYLSAKTGELQCHCNDRPVQPKSDGDHKLHFAGKRHKNGMRNRNPKQNLTSSNKSVNKNITKYPPPTDTVLLSTENGASTNDITRTTQGNVSGYNEISDSAASIKGKNEDICTTSSDINGNSSQVSGEMSQPQLLNITRTAILTTTSMIAPAATADSPSPVKRKVGRPKGSTNKNKINDEKLKKKRRRGVDSVSGTKNKKKKNLTAREAFEKFGDYGYYLGEIDGRLRCSCNHKVIRDKDSSDHNRHFLTSKHKRNVGKSPTVDTKPDRNNGDNDEKDVDGTVLKKKRKTMLTKEEALAKFGDRGYYLCPEGELRCSCNNKVLVEKDETDHLRHILTQRHQDGLVRSENLTKLGLDPMVVMAGPDYGGGDGPNCKKRRKNFLKKEEAFQLFMKKGYYLDDDKELRCACNNKLVSEKDETDHLRHFFTEKHKKMMLLRSKMRMRKTFLSHEQALQKFPNVGYYFDATHVLRCACTDKIVSLKKDANAHKCHFNSKRHRKYMEERNIKRGLEETNILQI